MSERIISHTAKHTYVDLAGQGNAALYSISKALGHSSTSLLVHFETDVVSKKTGSYHPVTC